MFKWLLVPGFALTINSAAGQSLDIYGGFGVGADKFSRDKTITTGNIPSPVLFSPQLAAGLRIRPKTSFILLLDFTLGLSRIQLPAASSNTKVFYEQTRSLITLGSGLFVPLERERYLLPYIQLGTGFFDFNQLRIKDGTGSFNTLVDYKTNHWVAVCGAGVEYKFNLFFPSAINFRVLYTPIDIFPEPFKYSVNTSSGTKDYTLQGKLTQLLLTFQVPITLRDWSGN
jgi:hypothetical protein